MNVALRVSTPVTVGVFVVSAVTGVLLFFHLGERLVKGLHEWIGLAFVAFALLHILRNWRALVGYARKPVLWVGCAASLVAAAGFIVPALGAKEGGGGGDAQRRLTQVVMGAPIEQVAPLLATTVPALTERLTTAGFKVEGGALSLNEIAKASGRSPRELVELVVAGLPPAAGGPGGR